MNTSRVLFSALGLGIALGLAGCGDKKDKSAPKPSVASAQETPAGAALPTLGKAPNWQLKDLNGNVVGAQQLQGKVVVVDFWATWCGPCRMEIPGYVDLAKKYGKDGLVIVGVSLDEGGPDVVKKFAQQYGVNYTLAMGSDEIQQQFGGMEAIPTTFLIDRTGNVRDRKVGAEPTEEYEKKIVSLLRG